MNISLNLISLLLMILSCIGIVFWIFRPHSRTKYKQYSEIPFKDDVGDK